MMNNATQKLERLQSRRITTTLILTTILLTVAACGSSPDASSQQDATRSANEPADGEHFLSEQQQALERAKAAARAMEEAASQRAQQTEAAHDN
jgi:hypothetical protein